MATLLPRSPIDQGPAAADQRFRRAGVAWYRFRATLDRRWPGYVAIVVLTGLLGGVAMGSVAAARRTQSSYPAFLAHSDPSDLFVSSFSSGGPSGADNLTHGVTSGQLVHLPHVRAVASSLNLLAAPLDPEGAPDLAQVAQLSFGGSLDGQFIRQDRVAVHGRMFNPDASDEFVTTAEGARLLGLHVGGRIPLGIYTLAQTDSPGFGTSRVPPRDRLDAKLVGIVVFDDALVEDDIDAFEATVLFTPALLRKVVADSTDTSFGLQLIGGRREVPAVEEEFARLVPPRSVFEFHQTSLIEARVERVVKPDSIALAVFGVIAALAAIVLVGLTISRQLQAEGGDRVVLRALGAGPRSILAAGLVGVAAAVASGTLLAGAVAVALSTLSPIGPVHPVYPNPGPAFDWTVLGLGALTLLVGLAVMVVPVAIGSLPHHPGGGPRARGNAGSSVARAAASARLSPAGIMGIRFALDPGAGRDTVPVRSALGGACVAVIIVTATLTFGSGMRTLIARPELYGWNWNYLIYPGNQNVPQRTLSALRRDGDVAAASGVEPQQVELDGQEVPALLVRPGAQPAPPILSGHAVAANDQIVVGGATLRQLHKRLGDTVVLTGGAPQTAPLYVPPTRLVIVGTSTLPAIGYPSEVADHTSMGTGAIVSLGVEPPALRRALLQPDPLSNGPAFVLVRLRPALGGAGLANLRGVVAATNRALAADPDEGGNSISLLGVQRPAEIVNYQSTDGTPLVLAASLATGAILALSLTLAASVRRRRADLALLRALGFSSGQLAATVGAQASVAAVVGTVVGLPLGVALGRWLWTLFARSIYAVPRPTVPGWSLLAVAVGAVVLANGAAALPGRRAATTPVGLALRAE